MSARLAAAMTFVLVASCRQEEPAVTSSLASSASSAPTIAPSAAPVAPPDAGAPSSRPSPDVGAGGAVRLDNQRIIGQAALPFAKYLIAVHNRIHPSFDGELLRSLDRAPADDPRNERSLVVRVELQLTSAGALDRISVIRSSGVEAFDVAALDAVRRAAPFGEPPAETLSFDGKVYVHWDLHRDEVLGCSTMFARPFLLTTK